MNDEDLEPYLRKVDEVVEILSREIDRDSQIAIQLRGLDLKRGSRRWLPPRPA